MNDVPKDFTGKIFIEGNARVIIIHAYYLRVVARGNSSVVARGNSFVEAWGNSQIVNRQFSGKIKLHGNAREVFMPKTVQEFMDFYDIQHTREKSYSL